MLYDVNVEYHLFCVFRWWMQQTWDRLLSMTSSFLGLDQSWKTIPQSNEDDDTVFLPLHYIGNKNGCWCGLFCTVSTSFRCREKVAQLLLLLHFTSGVNWERRREVQRQKKKQNRPKSCNSFWGFCCNVVIVAGWWKETHPSFFLVVALRLSLIYFSFV